MFLEAHREARAVLLCLLLERGHMNLLHQPETNGGRLSCTEKLAICSGFDRHDFASAHHQAPTQLNINFSARMNRGFKNPPSRCSICKAAPRYVQLRSAWTIRLVNDAERTHDTSTTLYDEYALCYSSSQRSLQKGSNVVVDLKGDWSRTQGPCIAP
jgi:hypothetical protein